MKRTHPLFTVLLWLSLMTWASAQTPPIPPTTPPAQPIPTPAVPPKAPVPAPTATEAQFLKISIKGIKVWPAKPSGRCWDPCLGRKLPLPPRGNKIYATYFDNKNFRTLCNGTKAPDPSVEIKIGKYEAFTTTKADNKCDPEFNISHTFRVTPGAAFQIKVYDNDGLGSLQVKRDLMGSWIARQVPQQLLRGGSLILKNFGQIERLELSAEVVRPQTKPGCEGVYKVRIVEYSVKETKETGKPWDNGFGRFKRPDVIVSLRIGNQTIETPKQQDKLNATFTDVGKTLPLKKGTPVVLNVADKDPLGKRETIGQTATTDICKIINNQGTFTFQNFGQVNKVVLIFEKQQEQSNPNPSTP